MTDTLEKVVLSLESHCPKMDNGPQSSDSSRIVEHEVVLGLQAPLWIELQEDCVMLVDEVGQVHCRCQCKGW